MNGTDTLAAASIGYSYTYNSDGSLSRVNLSSPKVSGYEVYGYDNFDRVADKVNSYKHSSASSYFTIQTHYEYEELNDKTTGQVARYFSLVKGTTYAYEYTYDANGNITSATNDAGKVIRYAYDDLGQLLREDNEVLNKTYVYTYDNAGNITSKKTYNLTAEDGALTSPTATYNYTYGDSTWGDKLTSYRGHTITYDAIGNPISYYNGSSYTFAWTGRRLASATKGGLTYTYTYNDEGIRTSKTVNDVTTTYYLNGSQIVGEETSGNITLYLYDASGSPVGMQYHGASYAADVWDTYWFEKNLQGDIVAVYDTNATKLIYYKYDAWGNTTVTYSNGGASTTATKNPFRYRGYYYDSDLELYYLQTRYYDAKIGRFINADGYVSTGQGILGNNMYAYCNNNPVMYCDHSGEYFKSFLEYVADLITYAIVANVFAIIESEVAVANSDVEPMSDDQYDDILNNKDTSGLSREEQIAYIRKYRERILSDNNVENDQVVKNWSEADMLREIVYHDRAYRFLKWIGLEDIQWGKQSKVVDFEEEQTFTTYFKRAIGNMMFW